MGKSDEVRRLLDERGVEHRDNDANRAVRYTRWNNGGKREVRYEEWSNGTTRLDAGNVTPEQAIAATVGRSCASCPEMDNPDSYISHIHAALKWHDEHVPRPTNPRNTCVVLEGKNPPDEVMFVVEGGSTTHYLPEGAGTCRAVLDEGYYKGINGVCEGLYCSKCKEPLSRRFKHCPWCGRKIKED